MALPVCALRDGVSLEDSTVNELVLRMEDAGFHWHSWRSQAESRNCSICAWGVDAMVLHTGPAIKTIPAGRSCADHAGFCRGANPCSAVARLCRGLGKAGGSLDNPRYN